MTPDEERGTFLGRAEGVKYASGPLLGPKVGTHGASPPTIRRLRVIQDRANALAEAAARLSRKVVDDAIRIDEDDARSRDWRDVLERGRAAISTGHQTAAIARSSEGAAEIVCAAYGDELKDIGKEAEKYARWRCDCGNQWRHGSGRCGDTTLQLDCDPSLWGRVHPGDATPTRDDDVTWLAGLAEWASDIARKTNDAAEPCERIYRDDRAAAVREWAHAASNAGAAAAHRWTRVPEEWRPETVEEEDLEGTVTVTANPGAVVDAERKKWMESCCPVGTMRRPNSTGGELSPSRGPRRSSSGERPEDLSAARVSGSRASPPPTSTPWTTAALNHA